MGRSAVPVLVVVGLVAACAGSPTTVKTAPTSRSTTAASLGTVAAATNPTSTWPTYHRTNSRAGDLGASAPALTGTLFKRWTARLDGAVYGQPILVGRTAIAATENNTVYALDVSNGRVVWSRHLGTPVRRANLPCGNIDPLGITGTPAYDGTTGSVFVVTETTGGVHTLRALAATTGALRWSRSLDVLRSRNKAAQQQRSALLVTGGRVITSFGGLYGDCGNYGGYLTSVPTTGQGATTVYAVPTAREAGIWAAGGQMVGSNGLVYASVGNGAATGGTWDGSDSVLALRPATLQRVYSFHPSTWADDNARDLDLGSLAPVSVAGKVVIAGKRGVVYLLGADLRLLASRSGCVGFGGAAVRGTVVYLPCTSGLRALKVGSSSLAWSWQATGIPGSPVLSGGVAYALDPGSRTFFEVSLGTGKVLRRLALGVGVTRFASPTIANGGATVLVPTTSGVVAIG